MGQAFNVSHLEVDVEVKKRSEFVGFVCSPQERQMLEELARRRGTTLSREAREAIRIQARVYGVLPDATSKEGGDDGER